MHVKLTLLCLNVNTGIILNWQIKGNMLAYSLNIINIIMMIYSNKCTKLWWWCAHLSLRLVIRYLVFVIRKIWNLMSRQVSCSLFVSTKGTKSSKSFSKTLLLNNCLHKLWFICTISDATLYSTCREGKEKESSHFCFSS